jgi:hypothetical protein
MPARAEHAHAERRTKPADILADPARTDDAGGFAVEQQRAIALAAELSRVTIGVRVMKALGEMHDAGECVFGDRQRRADAARRRHHHVASPQVAHAQVAGAGRRLVKPFQFRRALAQVEREGPAAEDDFGLPEQSVAFRAAAVTLRGGRKIAAHAEIRPGLAHLAVIPATRVCQLNRSIDRFNLLRVLRRDALNGENLDLSHHHSVRWHKLLLI